jgi:serine/threonine protein kinase
VKEILATVMDLPASRRAALLAEACGDDHELRREVESLLSHVDAPGVEIAEAVADAVSEEQERTAEADALTSMPERLADYRLLRVLGEGGMGVVYLAEQDAPRRIVALKVMRPGFAGRQLLRRFRREAELLGRLQHPNIAQIHAAGSATLEGPRGPRLVPYFAMEYVRGRTISDHCRELGLGVADRVRLFVGVCDAVDYAHAQGIVHRDLKPANILVEDRTGTGVGPPARTDAISGTLAPPTGIPKILDFGIARRADHGPADRAHTTTVQTELGQVVGTLPYMSPEQVSGAPGAVDRRSDVYALGVILYQLLAGRLPLELGDRTIAEAVRMVSEDDPPGLATLDRGLRGDLDTIAAKCLEKDPARRYQSAAALADDLRRFLDDRPIEARRPSTIYQLAKFARRHRGLVAGLVVAVAVLVASTIVAAVLAFRATKAEHEALRMLAEAGVQNERSAQSYAVLEALFTQIDPAVSKGRELTLREVVDRARDQLMVDEVRQPEVVAMLLRSLGSAYLRFGDLDSAERTLARSVEIFRQVNEGDPGGRHDMARVPHMLMLSLSNYGNVLRERGKYPQAAEALSEAVRLRLAATDTPDVVTAAAYNDLGLLHWEIGDFPAAERELGESIRIERAVHPSGSIALATTLVNLGSLHLFRGEPVEAERLLRDAIEMHTGMLGPDDPQTLVDWNNLSVALRAQARYAEAVTISRDVIERRDRILPPDHPDRLTARLNLAVLAHLAGHPREAEPELRSVLEKRRAIHGEDHPDTARAAALLACSLGALGQLDEASSLLEDALRRHLAKRGDAHVRVAEESADLATLRLAQGRPEEALEAARRSLAVLSRASVAGSHPARARALREEGRALAALLQPAVAEARGRAAIAEALASLVPLHPDLADAQLALASTLLIDPQATRATEALALADEARSILATALPEAPWRWAEADVIRAIALRHLGRHDQATSLLAAATKTIEAALGPDAPATRAARAAAGR